MEHLLGTANRGSVSTGYDIDNSLRIESNESEYMHRTPSSSGTRTKWTYSAWVKRADVLGAAQNLQGSGSDYNSIRLETSNALRVTNFNNGSVTYNLVTRRLFRDCTAWYHIVAAMDTTQGTASNRLKLYINGVQETDFSTETYPSEDYEDNYSESSRMHQTGARYNNSGNPTQYFSGYLAEVNFVSGTAESPTAFGEFDSTTGIWKPKAYSGSHGTNGFHLKFDSSGSLGADSSGSSNTFTLVGLAATNQTTDSPTNNFCVLNPRANNNYDSPQGTLEMGGCRIQTGTASWTTFLATMPFSSGKWYWEMEDAGNYMATGILNVDRTHLLYEVSGAEGVAYRTWNGGALARDGNADVSTSQGAPDSNNWVWGFWIDMDNNKFSVANRDGATGTVFDEVDIGACFTNGRMVIPFVRQNNNTDTNINFGNGRWRSDNMMGWYASFSHNGYQDDNGYGNFEYSPNANGKSYYALCTKNLAEFGG